MQRSLEQLRASGREARSVPTISKDFQASISATDAEKADALELSGSPQEAVKAVCKQISAVNWSSCQSYQSREIVVTASERRFESESSESSESRGCLDRPVDRAAGLGLSGGGPAHHPAFLTAPVVQRSWLRQVGCLLGPCLFSQVWSAQDAASARRVAFVALCPPSVQVSIELDCRLSVPLSSRSPRRPCSSFRAQPKAQQRSDAAQLLSQW